MFKGFMDEDRLYFLIISGVFFKVWIYRRRVQKVLQQPERGKKNND